MGDRSNPIKFGPEWLRNFNSNSAGGSGGGGGVSGAGGGGGGGSPSTSGHNAAAATLPSKILLANLRYGKEEMLALYEKNSAAPPSELKHFDVLYNPRGKPPVALNNSFDEVMRDSMGGGYTASGGIISLEHRNVPGRGATRGSRPSFVRPSSIGRGFSKTSPGGYMERGAGEEGAWSGSNGSTPGAGRGPAPEQPTPDWSQPMYRSKRWQGSAQSWRRSQREDGEEWRSPESGRPRSIQPQDKWDREWGDRGRDRGQSSHNRRGWTGDNSDAASELPEWAVDNIEANNACGGTFDSQGAFHGYSNDDTSLPKPPGDPVFPLARSQTQGNLARSHTQGSFTRPRPPTLEEGSDEWWASEKAKKLSPKRFDTNDVNFKKQVSIGGNSEPGATPTGAGGSLEESHSSLNEPPEKDTNTDPKLQQSYFPGIRDNRDPRKPRLFSKQKQLVESKTFDALMRSDINQDEASDERGNFKSVMITPNNSLRQKHQNITAALNADSQTSPTMPSPTQLQTPLERDPKREHDLTKRDPHIAKIVDELMGLDLEPSSELPIPMPPGGPHSISSGGYMRSSNPMPQYVPHHMPEQATPSRPSLAQMLSASQQNFRMSAPNATAPIRPLAQPVRPTTPRSQSGPSMQQPLLQSPFTSPGVPTSSHGHFPRMPAMPMAPSPFTHSASNPGLSASAATPRFSTSDTMPLAHNNSSIFGQSLMMGQNGGNNAMPAAESNQVSAQSLFGQEPLPPAARNYPRYKLLPPPPPPPEEPLSEQMPAAESNQVNAQSLFGQEPRPTAAQSYPRYKLLPPPPPPPEEPLSEQWYYEDPNKTIQGPFTPKDMYNWYRAGFFTSSLMVRRGCDAYMRSLGSYGRVPPFIMSLMNMPMQAVEQLASIETMNFMSNNNASFTPQHQPSMVESLWSSSTTNSEWGQSTNPEHMQYLWSKQHQQSGLGSGGMMAQDLVKDMKTEDEILAQLRSTQALHPDVAFNTPAAPAPAPAPAAAHAPTPAAAHAPTPDAAHAPTHAAAHAPAPAPAPPLPTALVSAPAPAPPPSVPAPIAHPPPQLLPVETKPEEDKAQAIASERLPKPSKSDDKSAKSKETPAKSKKKNKEARDGSSDSKEDETKPEKKSADSSPSKSKKEDKQSKKELDKEKKELIKDGFTIVKGADKATNKINKKKAEEMKALEEAERKRKEEERLALEEEKPRKQTETVKKQQTEQDRTETVSRKAPWCDVVPGLSPAVGGPTLADIQRLEREKKLEQMKEQQAMMQLIAQQQQHQMLRDQEMQANLGWAKKKDLNLPGQSLAEIQAEARRAAAAAAAAAAVVSFEEAQMQPQPINLTPWGPTSNGGGFWDTERVSQVVQKAIEKSPEPKPVEQKKKKNVAPAPAPAQAAQPPPPKKETSPAHEFETWCSNFLSVWSSKIDVPTFVGFLKDIESPYEVKEYVKCYLGDSRDSNDFARQFLERRSKLLRAGMVTPVDDLAVPAAAINPRAAPPTEYQEVKGKGKKAKKNKMLKIDARILGFSVTASEDRINVGDIDTV